MWTLLKEVDFTSKNLIQINVDTRDFCCALIYKGEDVKHLDLTKINRDKKKWYHTSEQVKELLIRLYDESGGEGNWRMLSLDTCGDNWTLKYLRIFRTPDGWLVCNSNNYALSKEKLDCKDADVLIFKEPFFSDPIGKITDCKENDKGELEIKFKPLQPAYDKFMKSIKVEKKEDRKLCSTCFYLDKVNCNPPCGSCIRSSNSNVRINWKSKEEAKEPITMELSSRINKLDKKYCDEINHIKDWTNKRFEVVKRGFEEHTHNNIEGRFEWLQKRVEGLTGLNNSNCSKIRSLENIILPQQQEPKEFYKLSLLRDKFIKFGKFAKNYKSPIDVEKAFDQWLNNQNNK